MRNSLLSLAIIISLLAGGAARAASDCSRPVSIASGQVAGVADPESGGCAWRGIPYAEAPVGNLRFAAPVPKKAWTGVRPADHYGDVCVQSSGVMGGGPSEGIGMSEDCLNLNVWRPAGEGPFPVMVWIHGGGYYVGAGNEPGYWGDRLARAGKVIVVGINYRLGLFGFMAHPSLRAEDPHQSTGGYGSLDQALALNWVHDNIKGFGGDPSNITVFGQSAGGASVCTMIATPRAAGTFSRAIMQSGPCELSRSLEDGYAVSRDMMKKAGCGPDDIECMRRLPAETINKKTAGNMLDGFIYMPCHDGWLLTDTPLKMIEAGKHNKVDFLAGTVKDEFGRAVRIRADYRWTRPAGYESRLVKSFGFTAAEAAELVKLYPCADYNNRPVEAMGIMLGADACMQCPTHQGLLAVQASGNRAWFYRFEYDDMKLGKYTGSMHTAEVPFIFAAFDRGASASLYKGRDLTAVRELSRIMQGYWTNFATSGDPNGPGLPRWEDFSADRQNIMILDAGKAVTEPAGLEGRCGFWKKYTANFVAMANRLIAALL